MPGGWGDAHRALGTRRVEREPVTRVGGRGVEAKGRGRRAESKVSVGSMPAGAVEGDVGVAAGDGMPVQDVRPNAIKTAPVLMTVRREVLLGTRLSHLAAFGGRRLLRAKDEA